MGRSTKVDVRTRNARAQQAFCPSGRPIGADGRLPKEGSGPRCARFLKAERVAADAREGKVDVVCRRRVKNVRNTQAAPGLSTEWVAWTRHRRREQHGPPLGNGGTQDTRTTALLFERKGTNNSRSGPYVRSSWPVPKAQKFRKSSPTCWPRQARIPRQKKRIDSSCRTLGPRGGSQKGYKVLARERKTEVY